MTDATSTGRATWGQFARRMVGIAERECIDKGFAVLSVQILVGSDGEPLFWTEPQITRIEPRIGGALFMEKIMRIIAGTPRKE